MDTYKELHSAGDYGRAPVIAAKAWNILVAFAKARRPITYAELAERVGFGQTANTITKNCVVYIMAYCEQEKSLPALNAIVCNRSASEPGGEIPNWQSMFDVFDYDWWEIVPPGPNELYSAWQDWKAS